MQRIQNLGEVLQLGMFQSGEQDAAVRRILRNSTHAVITRVPDFYPHEESGIVKLPGDAAALLLPDFNVSGQSEAPPRHWVLNDLGFYVNWGTSVELSLLADA